MSLVNELLEISDEDEEIVKSFHSKDSLPDTIFKKSEDKFIMQDDVRKKLLEISDDFLSSLGVDFFVHDVVLTGSLSNFNWSKYSDVDLHILMDFEELGDSKASKEVFKEFFDAKKNVWNANHKVKIKGFDVEIYVQDIHEPHVSSGVYSILNNKWVVEPEKDSPKIDERKILEKGEEYAKKIDNLIEKGQKEDVVNQIDDLKKKIKAFRQSGLEKGGEYSYENLTFKLLRRNGYIEKLLDFKKTQMDKKLSLPQ